MPGTSKVIQREFEKPFILSKSHINRIIEILDNKFAQIKGKTTRKQLGLLMNNGKVYNSENPEEIFRVDNSKKNPVKRLDIEYNLLDGTQKNRPIPPFVSIKFHGNDQFPRIETEFSGDDFKWLSECSAEIEEQVDRIVPESLPYKLLGTERFRMFFFLAPLIAIMLIPIWLSSYMNSKPYQLFSIDPKHVQSLQEQIAKVKTADDKINIIYQIVQHNLHDADAASKSIFLDPKTYFLMLPLLIIIGSLFYIYKYCYPVFLFEWNDMAQWHTDRIRVRRFLWGAIIVAFVIGVLGNIFMLGLTPTLAR